MVTFFQTVSAGAFAACLLALGGCSNPASEAPVTLKSGLYATSIGASGKPGPGSVEVCFADGDDVGNINKLIRKQFALMESCVHKPGERAGNAIGGTVSCKIDDTAGHDTTYTGTVGVESLTISATSTSYAPRLGSDGKDIEKIATDIPVTAQRKGDC